MTSRRLVLAAFALALVGGLLLVGAAIARDGGDRDRDGRLDVEAALRHDRRCDTFADSLPPLVVASSVDPGDVVADVTVCLRSRGGSGPVTVAVTELVDVESGCTGDEALADASCGGDAIGELSTSLVQQMGWGSCGRRQLDLSLGWDRPLAELANGPVTLGHDLHGRTCVRLRLVYEPTDAGESSQSDRTTWRYAFSVTAQNEREGSDRQRRNEDD